MQFNELNIERNNLMLNVVGLASYIYNNKEYDTLKFSYRMWMKFQLLAMRFYLYFLNKRLSYGTNIKRDSKGIKIHYELH